MSLAPAVCEDSVLESVRIHVRLNSIWLPGHTLVMPADCWKSNDLYLSLPEPDGSILMKLSQLESLHPTTFATSTNAIATITSRLNMTCSPTIRWHKLKWRSQDLRCHCLWNPSARGSPLQSARLILLLMEKPLLMYERCALRPNEIVLRHGLCVTPARPS